MSSKLRILFAISLLFFFALTVTSKKLSSLDNIYKKGLDAYLGERWSECIAQFEGSLHLYKLYKSILINCRSTCNQLAPTSVIQDIEDFKLYEKFFVRRNCLIKCNDKEFASVNLSSEIQDLTLRNMKNRKPYEYLHICYFNMYSMPKAANAALTYLIAHPSDETMKKNLEYYRKQPEIDVNEIIDLESEDYEVTFNLGLKTYKNRNWLETIAAIEETVTNYIDWENRCRLECEDQPEQERSLEFVITISNNIASLVQCRQQCQNSLKHLNYNSGVEFLADMLNYLQICYYNLDKIADAAKAVTSYLALIPDNDDMLENKFIYSTLIDEATFIMREDIESYKKKDLYEQMLLNYYYQEDSFKDAVIM